MLNKKIVDLLNSQINKEFYSSYLYLDMSNYYYDNNLNGFGNWFGIQTQEEHAHAMLFIKYMQNNGEKVVLEDIKKPDIVYTGFKQVWTKLINTSCISASRSTTFMLLLTN